MAGRHRLTVQSCGLVTFNHFRPGEIVEIDLLGESLDEIIIEPDQTIVGVLRDNRYAKVHVSEASHTTNLVGREICLATTATLGTPAGIAVYTTIAGCVAAARNMAYYHPEEVPADAAYGLPAEYNQVAARYGRLQVGGTVIFDVLAHPIWGRG